MAKVVSLLASSTEIVCALGYEHVLVGRSHECDFPESIKHLPICTSPKFPTDGTSYEIDEKIKAIVQEGLSVYRVDADKLADLQPDLILTQTQCHVCAVSFEDVESALRECTSVDANVISLAPYDLEGIRRDILKVADVLNDPDAGHLLVEKMDLRMRMIESLSRAVDDKPRIALIEWIHPLMSAGHWMPELVHMAGGEVVFGEAGKHSPWMKWEDLKAQDPDVILVAPCGFDLVKTAAEMHFLTGNPEWSTLKAVREKNVFIADGNQFFNRSGPRIVETLEIIAEILHPHLFHYGHENSGWKRFL